MLHLIRRLNPHNTHEAKRSDNPGLNPDLDSHPSVSSPRSVRFNPARGPSPEEKPVTSWSHPERVLLYIRTRCGRQNKTVSSRNENVAVIRSSGTSEMSHGSRLLFHSCSAEPRASLRAGSTEKYPTAALKKKKESDSGAISVAGNRPRRGSNVFKPCSI